MVADVAAAAVHPAGILRAIPRAYERDVARAVESLLDDGCLLVGMQRATYLGNLAPVELTAKGQAKDFRTEGRGKSPCRTGPGPRPLVPSREMAGRRSPTLTSNLRRQPRT
jgi:hypothetical protein